jgi:VIT1/CCC1 family predicted Fe2+/Mn2+ transporter
MDRASEILFGLIMVLTFTGSLSVADTGRAEVRAMLIAALGCNLAWGVIDATIYLMSAKAGSARDALLVKAVNAAGSPEIGRQLVAKALPAAMLAALSATDLERIRVQLSDWPVEEPHVGRQDYLGAVGVFLLVFLCMLPVALPFLIWQDARIALTVSNFIALTLLFLTGYALGRHSGRPWRVGLILVLVGVMLVAIAKALGG